MPHPLLERTEFAPLFRSCRAQFGRDDALLHRAFELRFQVYVQECRFLPANAYPDGLETDAYDAGAAHFCAFNLKDELVGYVRLVRPDGEHTFPFQQRCPTLLPGVLLAPPEQAAEVSRLIVRQDYRRRRGDSLTGVNEASASDTPDPQKRDNSPQILLSLYRQIYTFSRHNNIHYWYAAMETTLALVLTRMDFAFTRIGPAIDYYGPVTPFMANLTETETRVGQRHPDLLAWMQGLDTEVS